MEKNIEKRDHCEVAIVIKASGEEWSNKVKKEFNKRASKVVVPGFRPGKAPLNMIASRVDKSAVFGDASLALANLALHEALQENKIAPWSEPKLNIKKVSDSEMECEVVFCTQPELSLGQYTGLNIPCEEAKATANEVKEVVEGLQKEHAIMQVKEGKANKGDSVIIDFIGYVDDKPFDGGSAKGYELELGSNSFVPGFEDQLVGVKAGDKKVVEITFPENYVASLKGKLAKFDVEVLDVKEKILPELNDEFFKELNIDGVKDEASLKAHAKKQILANKEVQLKNAQVEKIINKAVENSKVVVPSSLINEEEELNLKEIKKQVEQAGLTYEDYVAINGLKEEELKLKRLEEAEKNLKSMIVVENIIAKENLNVSEKDLDEEYARVAEMYKMDVKSVKSALEANKEGLIRQLRNKKFTDFMLAHNEDKVEVKEEAKEEVKKAPAAKKTATTAAKKPAAKKTTKKVSE